MSFTLQLIIRLLVAGLLGAVIGYERELRAKGAGVRTHVLVALGAALFMIISQHGFAGADRFDAARVAAGVVTGIGFLGGGIIMKKTHVSGLTTAAGLWVTGAIGMGAGCGLYLMAGVCAFLVLFCLEVLNAYSIKFGQREVDIVLSSDSELSLMNAVQALGKEAGHFHIYKENGLYKVAINMRVAKRETPLELMKRLKELKDVALDSME
jgi:putative Mg2+ transporter-C (MgtC) family protein